jgi:catalase (peroxidase I)
MQPYQLAIDRLCTIRVDACDDSKEAFMKDFTAACGKVINVDRYELA